jgi:hypothetical protein
VELQAYVETGESKPIIPAAAKSAAETGRP